MRADRWSVVPAMCRRGILGYKLYRGPVNGESFMDFVETVLVPALAEMEDPVVVMDNCSLHHMPEVEAAIRAAGGEVLFLPPYSPELNPIELLFSKMKALLRRWRWELADIPAPHAIAAALECVTAQDCAGWYAHSCAFYTDH